MILYVSDSEVMGKAVVNALLVANGIVEEDPAERTWGELKNYILEKTGKLNHPFREAGGA